MPKKDKICLAPFSDSLALVVSAVPVYSVKSSACGALSAQIVIAKPHYLTKDSGLISCFC